MKTSAEQLELRNVPAAEARALLEAQEASGSSIAAFAREQGVRPWALYNARAAARRRGKQDAEPAFTEVRVVDERTKPSVPRGSGVELSLPSGLSVQINDGFDEVTLRRVLGILATC